MLPRSAVRSLDSLAECVAWVRQEAGIAADNRFAVGSVTKRMTAYLVARLVVDQSARQLANFFHASVELMQVMARACGHDHLSKFELDDLTTWKREMRDLAGVPYGGVA